MASNKRERELARMRAERQAARRAAAEARRKQRQMVIASTVAVLLIAAGAVALGGQLLGGDDDDTVASPDATPSAPASNSATSCGYTKGGESASDKKVELPPSEGVERVKPAVATLDTNRGKITLELDSAKAPCTSNSMRSLAHYLYFDGTSCHRLTTEGIFVLQCGDPSGTGSGGPGYTFPDENLTGATYKAGTVAMANSGPGTNGSQFFLVYKDSQLPPNYTPFGKITGGLDVINKVAAAGVDGGGGDGKPKQEVVIKTLRTRLKA